MSGAIALVIGIMGLGGILFTALRFNRDDTTAIVGQQSTVLNSMHTLNTDLQQTADRLKQERDALQVQVVELTAQISILSDQIREHIN